jgi:sugar O-acyltransferase (sialic acid O-acetyltransferase NeuD family)
MERLYIVGCGGHGRVILDILLSNTPNGCSMLKEASNGLASNIRFIDDNAELWGSHVDGIHVCGGTDSLGPGNAVYLGIGDNIMRRNLYLQLKARGCLFPVLIAPTSIISPKARIEEGAVIFHRAVVQTGARIGANAIINTAAVVEHDCIIDPHVQLAPMVALSGKVHVGEGTLMGTGSSANVGVSLGRFCLISPGLPVIKSWPDFTVLKADSARFVVEKNRRLNEIDGLAETPAL